MVGSNTGSIGVRFPSNRVAQELIRAAGTPIAAPSANKFMHVSPTKGSHVYDDLKFEDVHILDGEMSDLGVESTVVKVEWLAENFRVTLLRTGTFDFKAIQAKVSSLPKYRNVEFGVNKKRVTNSEHDATCAPGQLLKHYSPYVQTFLISQISKDSAETRGLTLMSSEGVKFGVIDFNRTNLRLQTSSRLYTDLDENGDFKIAMKNLYNELRKAESPEFGLSFIFLVNLQRVVDANDLPLNTLADKTYRSASGVEIFYDEHLNFYSQQV
jgi:hypothetical protein